MGFFIGGFEIIFMLVFFLVIVTMIVTIGRNLKQWNKNNHAPRLVVDAQVVAKRARVGLCDVSGGNRRPAGTMGEWFGLWNAGGRGPRKADVSGDAVSGI